jgi:signal transduction histidine kinase
MNTGHTPSDSDTHAYLVLLAAIAAREEERARLARDLHDHIGSQLTALRLMLEHHQTKCDPRLRATVGKALTLACEIDAEIDSLAWDLPPHTLTDLGLAAALRQLVCRWAKCARISAECRCDIAADVLGPDVEVTVYRVAQEALHNVVKHASATHVTLTGNVVGRELVMRVRDDGVGFDVTDSSAVAGGLGLRGMRERVRVVGGTLAIASAPGRGTTVSLRIPDALTP